MAHMHISSEDNVENWGTERRFLPGFCSSYEAARQWVVLALVTSTHMESVSTFVTSPSLYIMCLVYITFCLISFFLPRVAPIPALPGWHSVSGSVDKSHSLNMLLSFL